MRRLFSLVAACVIVAVVAAAAPRLLDRIQRSREIAERKQVVLPTVNTSPSRLADTGMQEEQASSVAASTAVNLDVPFTSQAPLANWDDLHGEACEEASVLMVLRYFQGKGFASPEEADNAIVKLVHDNTALGFAIDDTAAEVVTLIESQKAPVKAELLPNPTVDDIKNVLSDGALVIVPAVGRQLKNPYFQTPGPIYHMLVLRGYTDSGYVITNDPGTKRGKQFVYRWETLMNAMHDWNGGDVENGQKVVVVVRKAR